MAAIMKRQPAKKFWIADILNAQTKLNEQGFKQFTIRAKDTARVNLIAVIVSIYINENKTYAVATADDGSAQIRLRAWNEDVSVLSKTTVGDIALIIGRLNINEVNKEIFIRPEIVRANSIKWMELRRTELLNEYGQVQSKPAIYEEPPEEKMLVEEQIVAEAGIGVPLAVREKIMQAIEANDNSEGASIAAVISNSGANEAEASAAIDELIREGEAFQPKKGFIKLIP